MNHEIGRLFPVGGPVPPELVVGRSGDIEEIERRLQEGIHTMLAGRRRIGKTTVCDAACARLTAAGAEVISIEVPERSDATTLLQHIVDQCTRASLVATGRRVARAVRPLVERLLAEQGIPLDLRELDPRSGPMPSRVILALPLSIAEETGRRVILFLDEMQRAVSYVDGEEVLRDLVDLYSGVTDTVVLVDGSDERVLEGMLGSPVHFGKLCDRLALTPTIPRPTWIEPLHRRFEAAGLELSEDALDLLLAFGEGRPYETMAAARYTALSARKLGDPSVGAFEAQMGIDEAVRHLEDDGAR
ncbi:MAG TPA: ATP-binding protein [Conexibacter sp.]